MEEGKNLFPVAWLGPAPKATATVGATTTTMVVLRSGLLLVLVTLATGGAAQSSAGEEEGQPSIAVSEGTSEPCVLLEECEPLLHLFLAVRDGALPEDIRLMA